MGNLLLYICIYEVRVERTSNSLLKSQIGQFSFTNCLGFFISQHITFIQSEQRRETVNRTSDYTFIYTWSFKLSNRVRRRLAHIHIYEKRWHDLFRGFIINRMVWTRALKNVKWSAKQASKCCLIYARRRVRYTNMWFCNIHINQSYIYYSKF